MIRVISMLLALAALSAPAAAQSTWPDRPVRLIVPFPAGSATDVVSRLVAQKLTAKLGQQFVVENRAGASGAIGVDIVAKAAPDGTTMGLITASTHALAPALGAKLPYDTAKDFKPVSMIVAAPYALVLYPGIPVKTVADLVALAKASPASSTTARPASPASRISPARCSAPRPASSSPTCPTAARRNRRST